MYIVLGCKISYIGIWNFGSYGPAHFQAHWPFERCSSFAQTLILLRRRVGLHPHGQLKRQLYLFILYFFIHLFIWSKELKIIPVALPLMQWFIYRVGGGGQLVPLLPVLTSDPHLHSKRLSFRPNVCVCVCCFSPLWVGTAERTKRGTTWTATLWRETGFGSPQYNCV